MRPPVGVPFIVTHVAKCDRMSANLVEVWSQLGHVLILALFDVVSIGPPFRGLDGCCLSEILEDVAALLTFAGRRLSEGAMTCNLVQVVIIEGGVC